MPQQNGTQWYYRPANSAMYPRSPRPGMVDQAFMTELRPKTNANPPAAPAAAGVGASPRGLGTPRTSSSTATPRGPSVVAISSDDFKKYISRIGRPTMATRYRYDCPALSHSYASRTQTFDQKYIWNRLPVLEDSYRCMWSRHGGIKEGTKLGFRGQNV